MGWATWLRSLLGVNKKEKRVQEQSEKRPQEKKRWSFGKMERGEPDEGGPGRVRARTAEEAAWLSSVYGQSEKDQNKQAIAVAAATAAAADAAVAAAQAAVALVRLTSQGRGGVVCGGIREQSAAVKIQTVFKSYLAKKALRALKALVKLQALVRGYLVRKQAAATLHSMEALFSAQATVRAHKSRAINLINGRLKFPPEIRPPRSLERFDETRSEHLAASIQSRKLSAATVENTFEKSPKIVEIDTCRPKSRSSRRSSPSDPTTDDIPVSSPLTYHHHPSRITTPDSYYDWCLPTDTWRLSNTAQSTPRCLRPASPGNAGTPTKSYMASTQSFEAKVRSQSLPKQRPESARRRIPLSEVMVESRASLSGVGMERSCNKVVPEGFNFKEVVVERMDRDLYFQRKW